MPWDVALAVLLGAFLHAGWNTFVRSGADQVLNTVLVVTGMGAATALFLPFAPLPEAASWPYLAASMLIHVGYFTLLALAYQRGDLSLVYPIMRGSPPALTAVAAAAFLYESPARAGWAGILLVSGGILLLAADSRRAEGSRAAPVVLAVLNAGVIVVYTLVDGVGVRLSGHAFSYTGWMLLLTAFPFFLVARLMRGRSVTAHVRQHWQKGLIGGGCTFASYGLALWAMTQAPIALVASLRETSIVFGTLLAVFALRERVSPIRCASIALVVLGAMAIKVS